MKFCCGRCAVWGRLHGLVYFVAEAFKMAGKGGYEAGSICFYKIIFDLLKKIIIKK